MIEVVTHYLLFLVAFQPLEEYYNCSHPNNFSDMPHFVCTWEDGDFETIGERKFLKKEREGDNKYEVWGRQKYCNRKNKEATNAKRP